MPGGKKIETEFDPMGIAPAMMHCWRVAMFDMPMACALEMNACMNRWIEHQQEFMHDLAHSRDFDQLAAAQKKLFEGTFKDAQSNTVAFQRDVRAALESTRLN